MVPVRHGAKNPSVRMAPQATTIGGDVFAGSAKAATVWPAANAERDQDGETRPSARRPAQALPIPSAV